MLAADRPLVVDQAYAPVEARAAAFVAPALFCRWCGTEIDRHDVDANLSTWGVFKMCCTDCIEGSD